MPGSTGGCPVYTDAAIQTVLTLKVLFQLPCGNPP
ncbi:transposase [Laribacter hongkongensis]|nr:transposase [Laribacter hongkongensis]